MRTERTTVHPRETTTTTPPSSFSSSAARSSRRQATGAAAAGGVAGLVLAGPGCLALLAAGGAAYATTRKGEAGEIARSAGDSVSDFGRSMRDIDKKHEIGKKTKEEAKKGLRWIKKKFR
mmetsp:Transcript_28750/g.61711  ORF Transcript_28750/g.61711 Transcript_28750/m.61711 type:complete len:120 (-) Transcript_28750:488-847(-)|eukprot:CAMPEP_0201132344 /NCGR_PEP_ID=MMETSP0850-20130426/45492_1 /ASSEMBLY_ACC=CAM_ASM_000622 /TAXON_ID=183588 /ORGANISM="Pseudo-nitzschia fraudulenta, Strain WWA7" /LENGTH=119 /DNA_ID=CAMNT_0047402661 /DNA_START=147 /DNA_END=506 /DNA_ORIENTATION=-